MKKIWIGIMVVLLMLVLSISFSCTPAAKETAAEETVAKETAAEETVAEETLQELRKVRVGMSSFQDVTTIYVGIEQGFYEEAGIELDITKTDWSGANELLIGGHVDMATSSDQDTILQNAVGQDTTLAFPLFFFAGSGFVYDPEVHPDWKNIDEFLEETDGDLASALNMLLKQLVEDKAVIGISNAGEYVTYAIVVERGGYQTKDFETVDMANEDLPPALISGSIDVMISGIPPRLAAERQGAKALVDNSYFPDIVNHAGFAASRAWVDENFDLAVDIQKVILKTLDFVEKNPNIAFPIISNKLKEAGAEVTVEELGFVWNNMEYFPNSKEQYLEWVGPDGRFYWKERYQQLIDGYIKDGKLKDGQIVNMEDLLYGLKTVSAIE